ncbi:MAG: hypothetical protein NZ893_00500, partial [Candidatus Aenigmarchaeota archaeon]|nr:hypothetical protein [Candidatus Aenigmarchaeota archaeon]
AEILGVITAEVLNARKKFFEIDVSGKTKKEILDEILIKIKRKNKEKIIDWVKSGFEPRP